MRQRAALLKNGSAALMFGAGWQRLENTQEAALYASSIPCENAFLSVNVTTIGSPAAVVIAVESVTASDHAKNRPKWIELNHSHCSAARSSIVSNVLVRIVAPLVSRVLRAVGPSKLLSLRRSHHNKAFNARCERSRRERS